MKKLVPKNLDDMIDNQRCQSTSSGKECRDLIEKASKCQIEDENLSKLLTIDEAAAMLGVSAQSLRNWEDNGKITSERTAGNHRRYTKKQILEIRKQQVQDIEFLLPDITGAKIQEIVDSILMNFDPLEPLNINFRSDPLSKKLEISVESTLRLCSVCKSFNFKE